MLNLWSIVINQGMKKWQKVCGIQRKTRIGKIGCRIPTLMIDSMWHEQNISWYEDSSLDYIVFNKWIFMQVD